MSQQRPAVPGELCTCGRNAIVVYTTDQFGDVGHCGIEGAAFHPVLPCPWCGATVPHEKPYGGPDRCPNYQLRPAAPETPPETGEHGAGSAPD